MALHQSDYAKGSLIQPVPKGAGDAVMVRASFAVTAAIAEASGDIIEMIGLPPGCEVVDFIVDSDDLDSDGTPAILLDMGIMSGAWQDNDATRTCDDEFLDGSNVAQAGGVVRPTLATAFRVAKSDSWRSIGIKIATVADAGQAGTIGLTAIIASA